MRSEKTTRWCVEDCESVSVESSDFAGRVTYHVRSGLPDRLRHSRGGAVDGRDQVWSGPLQIESVEGPSGERHSYPRVSRPKDDIR
ncbi:hypothetical protein HSR121_1343 [Halapricum desulfuricans]|uniref:Uncharacterized protein n=1 Tax=Halapricum desulfuricans TaxID=2841257 RepID=A0A897N0A5_9EURY|nr:hypothetical protein HSR121_1343 [Halapricum desulfuricans]